MLSEKNTVLIDANVVLRYLLRDNEEFYRESETVFEDALSGKKKIYILQSVIAEVVYVLQKLYKISRQEISEVLSDLIEPRSIKVRDKETVLKALDIFGKKNLDFVDCVLCAYGKKYKVITFDKELKKCLKGS